MKQIIEFRMPEEKAEKLLQPSEGVCLGKSVRKLMLSMSDPLVKRITKIQKQLTERGVYLFLYSHVHYRYTQSEIQNADAFRLIIKHTFEPTGEQCGTIYDDSSACGYCGSGGQQISSLSLETQSLSKKSNLGIAKTIAGEVVVSQRFVDLFQEHKLKGAWFQAVRQRRNQAAVIPGWYQLLINSESLDVVKPTLVGINHFDDASIWPMNRGEISEKADVNASWCDKHGQYRCPLGHTIGLNLLSELSIKKTEGAEIDIAWTKQKVGVRRGFLRPEPLLVISPLLWKLVLHQDLKGMAIEIAHTNHPE